MFLLLQLYIIYSNVNFCGMPENAEKNECYCECHKKSKLAIYGLYKALKMMEDFQFNRGGDMLLWYHGEYIEKTDEKGFNHLASSYENFWNFDKDILKDLSGKDSGISLYDFIGVMSKPAKICI